MSSSGREVEMTIQRTLAVLWIGLFVAGLSYWLWMFLNKSAPAYDGIHALQSPLLLFGIVASIFLFKGANWARISMGCIAIAFAVGIFIWEILPQDWMRADKWGDDAGFVLSLATIVLLFFVVPRKALPQNSHN
jgi:peptidoglycan/LPS O-acetylase OafA/YrhL